MFKRKNLDVAKEKMGILIGEEDIITCYDNLGPIMRYLKKSNISYDI